MERALCKWSVTSASMSQCPAAICTATREERLALASQTSGAPCSGSTVDISGSVPQQFVQWGLVREMHRRTRTTKYVSERNPLPPTLREPLSFLPKQRQTFQEQTFQRTLREPSKTLPGKQRKMGPGLDVRLDISQSLDHVCF